MTPAQRVNHVSDVSDGVCSLDDGAVRVPRRWPLWLWVVLLVAAYVAGQLLVSRLT